MCRGKVIGCVVQEGSRSLALSWLTFHDTGRNKHWDSATCTWFIVVKYILKIVVSVMGGEAPPLIAPNSNRPNL